jgi:hypothetical protein
MMLVLGVADDDGVCPLRVCRRVDATAFWLDAIARERTEERVDLGMVCKCT